MKRVLAVLIVAVVLLGVWLSGIGRRSTLREVGSPSVVAGNGDGHDAVDGPIAAVNGAAAERSSLAAAVSSPTSPTAASSDLITVRSSIGLELPFAEFENDAGEWTQVALEAGTCARSAIAGATNARAPGHVAVAVVPDAKEIVLEPDALLVIEADALRDCARTIEPKDSFYGGELPKPLPTELRACMAWGWLSDREWAITFSPLRLGTSQEGACEVHIRWSDGRRTMLTFKGKPGCRERWLAQCEQRVPGSPLHVHIDRPVGQPVGRLFIGLDRVKPGEPSGDSEVLSWGYVFRPDDDEFHELRQLEPGSSDFEFDFAPTGVRLNLTARDETSGAYGRLLFVHDGSPRTLALGPPFRLTGRLVPPEGLRAPTHADVFCVAFEGKRQFQVWNNGKAGLELDASGGFQMLGPADLVRRDDQPLEVPSRVVVDVMAPGFQAWEGSFDTHHAPTLDCGDIHLVEQPAEIVLAPGHGLMPLWVRWGDLLTEGQPQVCWEVRDAALLADGSMPMFLLRDGKDPKLLAACSGEGRAWLSTLPERFVIHVQFTDDDRPIAFERGPAGQYVLPPGRELEVEFDLRDPLDRTEWWIGWEWHGLSYPFASLGGTDFGGVARVHVRAPAEGTTLWWSKDSDNSHEPGGRGGSVPLDAVRAPIMLR